MLSTAFRGSLTRCVDPNARKFAGQKFQNSTQRMVVKVSSPVDTPAASAAECEGVPPAVLEGTDIGFVQRFGTLRFSPGVCGPLSPPVSSRWQ